MRLIAAVLICLFVGPRTAGAEDLSPIPALHARVTDIAGALSASSRSALESKLSGIEAQKGVQVAILIVDSTAPEAIEQYALRVAEAWKLGRKGVDDGILILLAMKDRAYRMEVGYGLEGAVPDVIAKRILDDGMRPHLQAGDVAGGLEAAVDSLAKVLSGESLPPPASGPTSSRGPDAAIPLVIGGLILTGILTGTGLVRRTPAAALSACIAFIIGAYLADMILGFIVSMFVFMMGAFADNTGRYSTGGRYRGGGYSGGGWSSGGGGFSGGGGSFGGGGASGRW